MYKTCATCGLSKPLSQFWKDKQMRDGYKKHCGLCCQKKRGRRIKPSHLRKRETINGVSPDGVTLVDKKRFVRESKEGKCCQSCGCLSHPSAMDWHHKNPETKSFTLTTIRRFKTNEITLQDIKDEIQKCILLCANCHRLIHAGVIELLPD